MSLYQVTAICARCATVNHAPPEYDREAALDYLDALGWWDLDTTPLCPNCASWEAIA